MLVVAEDVGIERGIKGDRQGCVGGGFSKDCIEGVRKEGWWVDGWDWQRWSRVGWWVDELAKV